MSFGSWRKVGGPGWAAMDGQLRSSNTNNIDKLFDPSFPPLTSNIDNCRSSHDKVNKVNDDGGGGVDRRQNKEDDDSGGGGVPMEPDELEESDDDDVYMSQRRDALRASRSASRHSRAASNAFLRGDHDSARRHSLAARRHSDAARSLHADAAAAISAARNSSDDPSTLDLHGLHAPEALRLLQLRLVQPPPPSLLHVITGVGNHSRGSPSLPSAVRGFLADNGYHFQETKPGVISVRLKFRLPSSS